MRRLYRSTKDKKIAGICGGIGEMLDWDPNQIRLLMVVIAVFSAGLPMVISYIAAWIILPEDTTV